MVLTSVGASAFHWARRERVLERETFRFGGYLPWLALLCVLSARRWVLVTVLLPGALTASWSM